jgi:hypothetical protein
MTDNSERQKETTDQYRENWSKIFDKNLNDKPPDPNPITLDVEADNGEQTATVTKTWSF